MKRVIVTVFLLSCFSCHKPDINGVYVGYEEMCSVDSTGKKNCFKDPSEPNWKWYYKVTLKISDSVVYVDQSPIIINNKDTVASASDGGFFYFKGKLYRKNNTITLSMLQTACDYCAERYSFKDGKWIKSKITKVYKGYISDNDLTLNGFRFKKMPKSVKLLSESR